MGGREVELGVYGRVGGVEQPKVREGQSVGIDDGAPEPRDGPVGWDFESARVSPFRRVPPTPGVVYAELPLRAVAFLIDLALIGVAVGVLSPPLQQVANLVMPQGGLLMLPPELSVIEYLILPILIYLASSAVFSVFFWTRFRASPGQMVLGLFTVTRADGLPLSRSQAVLRWLLVFGPATLLTGSASAVIVQLGAATVSGGGIGRGLLAAALTALALAWYGLLGMTVIGDRRGRGLHDKLAGSVVVRREGSPS